MSDAPMWAMLTQLARKKKILKWVNDFIEYYEHLIYGHNEWHLLKHRFVAVFDF